MSCDYNCFECAEVNSCNDSKRYINKRRDRKEYMKNYYQANREGLLRRANERNARKSLRGEGEMIERGNLRYKYTIHLDLEPIVDSIMDILKGYYDSCDFGIVGDDLRIEAVDTTPYKKYVVDKPEIEEVHVDKVDRLDMQKIILTALHDLDRVRTTVEIRSEEYIKEDL